MSILKHHRNLELNLTYVTSALVENWLIPTNRADFLICGLQLFLFSLMVMYLSSHFPLWCKILFSWSLLA